MPGIAGIIDLEGGIDLQHQMKNMLSSMKHESWYIVDQFQCAPMVLGRASLGIIDPYPQPVFSHDKALSMVMYGEVYDYPAGLIPDSEIGSCRLPMNHAQLALSLISKRGIDSIRYLNGSFVLALWDTRSSTLTLANDRFGLRPMYYFRQDRLFVFASEMKSILCNARIKRKVDIQALTEFLSLDAVLGDRTLLEEIKTLPPASVLTFRDGRIQKKSYWTLKLGHDGRGHDQRLLLDQTHTLVKQAVQRQLDDDTPKALSLSGGLDSRTILGAAAEMGYKIPTFTFGISGCPDQKLARQIADTLGMEHRFFELSPDFLRIWSKHGIWLTEGMNSCINFHGVEFVPEVRKKASVVINGYLGGELFGFVSLMAAWLFFENGSTRWIERLFRRINHPFSETELETLFTGEYYKQMQGFTFKSFKRVMQDCPFDSPFDKFYHFRFGIMAPKLFLYGLLLDNNLLEYRVPFADYDLVDFISPLPPRQKILAKLHRRLLVEKYPPLARIPYQRTGMPISSDSVRIIIKKFKEKMLRRTTESRNYSNYDRWMRHELKEFVTSTILSEKFLSRGYFNPDYVKVMVEQHMHGKSNMGSKIGKLLTFEIWNQLFVDETI